MSDADDSFVYVGPDLHRNPRLDAVQVLQIIYAMNEGTLDEMLNDMETMFGEHEREGVVEKFREAAKRYLFG